jgi:hypothetical protein
MQNTPEIPLLKKSFVVHVGSLEREDRVASYSHEGPCLSVSIHPDEWMDIARTYGTLWGMSCEGGMWFDATNIPDPLAAEMRDWAIREGMAIESTMWRSWYEDSEDEEWSYMICDSREQAIQQMGDDYDPDVNVGAPNDTGSTVDSVPFIGPSPKAPQIHFAFGAQHIGLTTGPKTGRLIADMIGNRTSNIDLSPFRVGRFD